MAKKSSIKKPLYTPNFKFSFNPKDGRVAENGYQADRIRLSKSKDRMNKLEEMLYENHKMIAQVGELLNKSQPASAGKIEVRWWAKNGYEMVAMPIIAQWTSDGPKELELSKVRKSMRTTFGFTRNLDETDRLLHVLMQLFYDREMLLSYLTEFNRKVGRFESVQYNKVFVDKIKNGSLMEILERRIDNNNSNYNKELRGECLNEEYKAI